MIFQKRRIRKAFERRLEASAGALRTCSELSTAAAALDLPDHRRLVNALQFALLAYRDLDIVTYENFQLRHGSVHRLHWRLWVVLIYGYLEKLQKILGGFFKNPVHLAGLDPAFLHTVGQVNSDMNRILGRNSERLNAIRNTVIAHRGEDAQEQIAVIDSLDLIWLSRLSREVHRHTEILYQALLPVLEQVASDIRARRESV